MAHKVINGNAVVDWTTGDPEGDRKHLFLAYQDFIKELMEMYSHDPNTYLPASSICNLIDKWKVSIDNQVDDFPRIWIKRPQS